MSGNIVRPWIRPLAFFLFLTLVFGLSYTQAPLYYSNQNQYFLHGLAQANLGFLKKDWLAGTTDPTPIFSALVRITYFLFPEGVFYLSYLLILGLYFHSLVGLFDLLSPARFSPLARLVFMTFLVVIHAGLLRLVSARILGVDYPWYFQAGLAGQYLLGFGLQPSVFGVLLLASVHSFLKGHPWRAVTWACVGATVHSTYLLAAAFLVVSYQWLWLRERGLKQAILLGLFALVLVTPVLVYNLISFAPTSIEEFAEAQGVIAHFRIPHHAEPARWFDIIAAFQVGWMVLAGFLVRKTRLFVILLIPFLLSLLLTLLQLWTDNDTLALLFPWRTSAVLVPLATAIVLGRFAGRLATGESTWTESWKRNIRLACGTTLVLFLAGGCALMVFRLGYPINTDELPMMEFVKTHAQPGDVYMLPVQVPRLGGGKPGAFSTNFTPAPRSGEKHLIAIDLQSFRLASGAPIFVDFKSIPYKDTEVLEWQRRLFWCHERYTEKSRSSKALLGELGRNGITHVITTADRDFPVAGLEEVYRDESYQVYRVVIPKI